MALTATTTQDATAVAAGRTAASTASPMLSVAVAVAHMAGRRCVMAAQSLLAYLAQDTTFLPAVRATLLVGGDSAGNRVWLSQCSLQRYLSCCCSLPVWFEQ